MRRFLTVTSLALLQIVVVGNLQVLPANATYGAALPFLYFIAIVGFFLPCVLLVAELATSHPQTGGTYIWCEQAFGARVGFFTSSILWISNLLWYPSIFSFIAINFAYLIDPTLAQHKIFIVSFAAVLFWIFTGLNCVGIKFSTNLSIAGSIVGIITPILLIIAGGLYWILSHHPVALHFTRADLMPNLLHLDNMGLVIAVVISLFGIELSAVHAGDVVNPRRDYPRSLLLSGILLIGLLLCAEMAIAIIIPRENLSVQTGLLDTIIILLQNIHLPIFIKPILFLIFIGNIGSLIAWMLASTRGMYVACQHNHVAPFLQKINRHQAPIGVLLFEAIIFTMVTSVFLIMPKITDTFWLLLDLASQITLIYYIILFMAGIRLRYVKATAGGFRLPGGNLLWICIMLIGALTSGLALSAGFIAPNDLDAHSVFLFRMVMSVGLMGALLAPILLIAKKNKE